MDYARLKFEQYAEQLGHKDFERNEFGNYRNPFMQGAWNFWRASRDALPSDAAQAPVGYCMEGENHCVCGGDLPRVREGCANWRKVAASVAPAAAAPTQAEFVIRALIAAGHVTQAKVDEAIEIACKTPGVAPLAAAELTDEQRTTIQHAADKLRTVWANHTGDKESRELCHKLEAFLDTPHGDKRS